MTSYRYLGSGTTDSNGVAHLTEDASGETVTGYVGQGVGEMEIFATLDNPVTQSSIQSVPYTVIDAIAYDKGIKDDSETRDIWQTSSTASLTREDDLTGTTFTGNQYDSAYLKLNNSTSIPFVDGITVEFDVVNSPTGFRCNANDGSNHHYVLAQGHWKIVFTNNKMNIYKDNGTTVYADYSFNTSVSTFTFSFNTNVSGFTGGKFKEFRIYYG